MDEKQPEVIEDDGESLLIRQGNHQFAIDFLSEWRVAKKRAYKIDFYQQLALTCMGIVKTLKQKEVKHQDEPTQAKENSVKSSP
jgi:hypothetical protein